MGFLIIDALFLQLNQSMMTECRMLLVLHNLYKTGKSNDTQLSNFGLIEQLLPRPQK